ncbi:MAG: response regulator transcription factor [Clostridia bacterium]|nr:response regulator transcription factor [Clostridia bacterium]MBQ8503480.1 response regulator transcription factor [Clostridia bacterium]
MKRILIAEDETAIREFIVINLRRSGYDVVEAANGRIAIEKYNECDGDFDVALLDIMMPEVDGLEVCKYLRQKSSTIGIIMLTAKSQEMDKVTGLLVGADDYVIKPFSPSELMARVDAIYRRVSVNKEFSDKNKGSGDILTSGEFTLNMRTRSLNKNGEEVELTQVEFQIMEYVMRNPDVPLSRLDILEYVWGTDYYGDEKVVDVNIRRLRMKIEEDSSAPEHLLTVWGLGYKWIP